MASEDLDSGIVELVSSASEDGMLTCGEVPGVWGSAPGEVAPLIGTIGH